MINFFKVIWKKAGKGNTHNRESKIDETGSEEAVEGKKVHMFFCLYFLYSKIC